MLGEAAILYLFGLNTMRAHSFFVSGVRTALRSPTSAFPLAAILELHFEIRMIFRGPSLLDLFLSVPSEHEVLQLVQVLGAKTTPRNPSAAVRVRKVLHDCTPEAFSLPKLFQAVREERANPKIWIHVPYEMSVLEVSPSEVVGLQCGSLPTLSVETIFLT